ncbi:hypothetical protein [Streptomyces sp. NRRL S-1813]|uniref:hypothetical protein n=1 Tax=Streptomyces sp. NRRL S-1813 TaxID=1463888 RepID=UPI0004C7DE57|nr:hypothetical protein [Streptomyces sp. NRRL S-1813]
MADDKTNETDGSMPAAVAAFVPTPEVVQQAEQARKDLEAMGIEVEFHTKWWGFELHCNQEAIEGLQEIRDLVLQIVENFLPKPLAQVISAVAQLQKLWMKEVSKGHGAKLVSPWFAPTMLIPVGLGPKPDLDAPAWCSRSPAVAPLIPAVHCSQILLNPRPDVGFWRIRENWIQG